MKITEIKVYFLKKSLSSTMRISRGGFGVRTHTLVEVITDEGVTGLGEGVGNAKVIHAILDGPMKDLAIGLDPFQIEKVRRQLLDSHVYYERMGSVICAASAIEMACWDIKGKALGVPVYEILGGLAQEQLKAYVSDIYWEESPKSMAENARRILDLGFRSIKAHLGHGNVRSETERIQALREEIGPEIELMIDLNCGYTYSEALRALQKWDRFELKWLEEPLDAHHFERQAELKEKSLIPIAGGENEFKIHGFKQLLDRKSVDIAMPDIGRAGGIQECKNICSLAEAFGIEVSPHNFSSGVLMAATIQLMASTPNCTMLEYDSSENAILNELLIDPLQVKDGFVTVPRHPGLGVVLSEKVLQKYRP